MNHRVFARFSLLFCVALAVGCDSDHDKCKTLCHWIDECTILEQSCSDSDIDECSDDANDLSDDCEHAFENFVDCLEDNDSQCDETLERCQGEWDDFGAQCGDEIWP